MGGWSQKRNTVESNSEGNSEMEFGEGLHQGTGTKSTEDIRVLERNSIGCDDEFDCVTEKGNGMNRAGSRQGEVAAN